MAREVEVQIYSIDVDDVRRKLESLGGVCVGKGYQIRFTYKLPEAVLQQGYTGYVRVRKEITGAVTMTSKRRKQADIFPEEFEITSTNSLAECAHFLESLGLQLLSYAEQYREKYTVPGVKEVVFDTMPGLATYLEIEADTHDEILAFIKALGFDQSQLRYGSYADTYHEIYGLPISVINAPSKHYPPGKARLTFAHAQEELGPYIEKNKDLFQRIAQEHKEKFIDPALYRQNAL